VDLPEVTAEQEEGFVDLALRLMRGQVSANGGLEVEARGIHQGTIVGFLATFGTSWTPKPIADTDGYFYWGTITLRSAGEVSDAFVRVLDALYRTNAGCTQMVGEARCTAVGLNTDPRHAQEAALKMKLFFEHADDDKRYAEVYLNVDLKAGRVEWHEKDPDYRGALVLGLGR
jgi:hypothetical protein